jgi:hypothetical protein
MYTLLNILSVFLGIWSIKLDQNELENKLPTPKGRLLVFLVSFPFSLLGDQV